MLLSPWEQIADHAQEEERHVSTWGAFANTGVICTLISLNTVKAPGGMWESILAVHSLAVASEGQFAKASASGSKLEVKPQTRQIKVKRTRG